MWQAQSFCCLYEDCLRIFSFVVTFPANWSESRRLRSLPLKHRCEEPLVWTVIPLLKPWAEPFPNTPDAIKWLRRARRVLALPSHHGFGRAALAPATCPRHPNKVLLGILTYFLMTFPRHPVPVEPWVQPPPSDSRLFSHCTCVSRATPRNSTRSGFCQPLSRGRGDEEGGSG